MCTCKFASKLFLRTFKTNKWKFRTISQVADAEMKKIKYKNHASELDAYFSSEKYLKGIKCKIPERYLKRNKSVPDDLYLVNKKVARTLTNALLPDLINQKGAVIESNPGFGFITEKLLDAGIPNVLSYEPTVLFREHLFKLNKLYPNRVKVYNKDFFSIWKLSYQDKYDNGNRVQLMLRDVEAKDWNDDVAMNIVGALANPSFIRHLMLSLILQYSLMTYGRCNIYICIPPYLYMQWTAQPSSGYFLYRPSSVILQTFCDFKLLAKVPRKSFLPWDSHVSGRDIHKKKFPHYYEDLDYMYFIKISFKRPLPIPVDRLQHYWFFTKNLMISRHNQVIPILEKWIPGCGWTLITKKPCYSEDDFPFMNIYTKIGDMTPPQILKLFMTFINWPEFWESSFSASVEEALLKMEQSAEDPLESNVKDDSSKENQEDTEKSHSESLGKNLEHNVVIRENAR